MMIMLGVIILVAMSAAVVSICYIFQRNRIRKAEETVWNEYLHEEIILQQAYFSAYSNLLRVAEEQERKAQNSAWSRW